MDSRRAKRLMQLLTTLHSGRSLTVDELADMIGVARRTVFRYLEILEQAGVPFRFDRSSNSYVIDKDCFIPPVSFTVDECLAMMFLTHKMLNKEYLLDYQSAMRASLKLESALPRQLQRHCQNLLKLMDYNPPARTPTPSVQDVFATLQHALREQKVVQLRYEPLNRPGEQLVEVHPYRIAFLKRAWYVVAYCEQAECVRTYKLARVRSCLTLGRAFNRDPDFDLEAYFGNAWNMIRGEPRQHVKLRFSPKVAPNVEEVMWHKTQSTYWLEDGHLIFEVDVDGLGEITWWILGYGDEVEVLEPRTLRVQIFQRAQRVCRKYREDVPVTHH